MQIIKQGDLSRADGVCRFWCTNCGCEWYAEPGEYEITVYDLIVCACPTCKKLIRRVL